MSGSTKLPFDLSIVYSNLRISLGGVVHGLNHLLAFFCFISCVSKSEV